MRSKITCTLDVYVLAYVIVIGLNITEWKVVS